MDPSLSISNDPHNPPQYNPYPTFPNHNTFVSGAVAPQNHNFFTAPNPYNNNNYVFPPQPQPQAPPPPQNLPSMPIAPLGHPPYSQMICNAIATLNEPDGSSKVAISKFIERTYPGVPPKPTHGPLLTHHLKSLKTSGVLALVKKSYKFATPSAPPESVAVAAAAVATGLEARRSEILPPPTNTVNNMMVVPGSASGSASGSLPVKRGRGRPPKPKPVNAPESVKRRPGRPRKNGSAAPPAIMPAPFVGAMQVQPFVMKRRGRPPGRRAAGRQRKPKSVSATASVFPLVANGARRRGRPRRVESSNAIVAAPQGGEIVAAVAPGIKRGRGRPPKVGGVVSRVVKPKRGPGRPVGRPRKFATTVTAGTQDSGEFKKKLDVFQEKVKVIVDVLKAGVKTEDQAVIQAIKELEGLTVVETFAPQPMEEVQPEETAPPQTDAQAEAAAATQGGEEGQRKEGGGGGEQQGQERGGGEAQTQTETKAMQEALF
ncbi:HMG-Y-related protein A [Cardamine amara subsp. amara]|uniref:HMG-Y-related protein A n=1 Tax=Cardamine amara subsp. amara TaxID=228776 RepID=A0ABD1A7K9_CARAN